LDIRDCRSLPPVLEEMGGEAADPGRGVVMATSYWVRCLPLLRDGGLPPWETPDPQLFLLHPEDSSGGGGTKVRGRPGLPTIGGPGFPLRGAGARAGDSSLDPAPPVTSGWARGGGGVPLPRSPGLGCLPLAMDDLGRGLERETRCV